MRRIRSSTLLLLVVIAALVVAFTTEQQRHRRDESALEVRYRRHAAALEAEGAKMRNEIAQERKYLGKTFVIEPHSAGNPWSPAE